MSGIKLSTVAAAVALAAFAAAAPAGQAPAKPPGFSDAGRAPLSKQMAEAVARGDSPGVVEIFVKSDATLFEGAAGKLDVRTYSSAGCAQWIGCSELHSLAQ